MTRPRLTSLPLLTGALLVAALLTGAFGGCGGSSGSATAQPQHGQGAVDESTYAGVKARPPKAARELKLDNSLGEAVDLSRYKGKAVLVTFIYTHCPDICPLIV